MVQTKRILTAFCFDLAPADRLTPHFAASLQLEAARRLYQGHSGDASSSHSSVTGTPGEGAKARGELVWSSEPPARRNH